MLFKEFLSIDKLHSFNISIIEDTAYFTMCELEPSQYKTFLLLLKKGFEFMISQNVKFVKQKINIDDKELFKKSSFVQENDILIVKTNIEDFLYELTDALGMKRL